MPILDNGNVSAYRILVSRGDHRPNATLYAFGVRQAIPLFPLPLKPADHEPRVDMGQLLHDLYDRASYDLRLDYREEAVPPLAGEDAAWADALLHSHVLPFVVDEVANDVVYGLAHKILVAQDALDRLGYPA